MPPPPTPSPGKPTRLLTRIVGYDYLRKNSAVVGGCTNRVGGNSGQFAKGQRILCYFAGFDRVTGNPAYIATGCARYSTDDPNFGKLVKNARYQTRLLGYDYLRERQAVVVGCCNPFQCGTIVWARFAADGGDYSGVAGVYSDMNVGPVLYIGPGDDYPPGFQLSDYDFMVIILPSQWDDVVNPTTIKGNRHLVTLCVGWTNDSWIGVNRVLNTLLTPTVFDTDPAQADDWPPDLDQGDPTCNLVRRTPLTYGFDAIGPVPAGRLYLVGNDGQTIVGDAAGFLGGPDTVFNIPPEGGIGSNQLFYRCPDDVRNPCWAIGSIGLGNGKFILSGGGIYGTPLLLNNTELLRRMHPCWPCNAVPGITADTFCCAQLASFDMTFFPPAAPPSLTLILYDYCCIKPVFPDDGPPTYIKDEQCQVRWPAPQNPLVRNFANTSCYEWTSPEPEDSIFVDETSGNAFVVEAYFVIQLSTINGCLNVVGRYLLWNISADPNLDRPPDAEAYYCTPGSSPPKLPPELTLPGFAYPKELPTYIPMYWNFRDGGVLPRTNMQDYFFGPPVAIISCLVTP